MRGSDVPNMWVNADPTLDFEDQSLAPLLRYWEAKRRGDALPSRRDIDPIDVRAHMGNLCLIEVEQAPLRMRYRLIGSNITEIMGRDSTGRYYDEIYRPELLSAITASFAWMIEHRRPLRSFGQAFYADKQFYDYEIVNLPLAEDGITVNMVLGKLVFRLASRHPGRG